MYSLGKVPSDGGYAVMAGLDKVIEYIKAIKFEERELDYFRSTGCSEKIYRIYEKL